MRYVMRQKFFSLADSFTIRDENERDVFLVKGKVFSFGDKLSFQDMDGNELVYIDQRLLNWSPTYELWRGADLLAVVKRELFSFIHHRFTVDVPGPDDLEAEGDFLDHEYTFTRGDGVVATVSLTLLCPTTVISCGEIGACPPFRTTSNVPPATKINAAAARISVR